jgi:hypothetical protein
MVTEALPYFMTEGKDSTVASALKKLGLREVSETNWEFRDQTGYVQCLCFPSQKAFFVTYIPATRRSLSPQVIASLVARAESIGVGNADVLLINFPAEEKKSGTLRHVLGVSLRDEAWVESKAAFQGR